MSTTALRSCCCVRACLLYLHTCFVLLPALACTLRARNCCFEQHRKAYLLSSGLSLVVSIGSLLVGPERFEDKVRVRAASPPLLPWEGGNVTVVAMFSALSTTCNPVVAIPVLHALFCVLHQDSIFMPKEWLEGSGRRDQVAPHSLSRFSLLFCLSLSWLLSLLLAGWLDKSRVVAGVRNGYSFHVC